MALQGIILFVGGGVFGRPWVIRFFRDSPGNDIDEKSMNVFPLPLVMKVTIPMDIGYTWIYRQGKMCC